MVESLGVMNRLGVFGREGIPLKGALGSSPLFFLLLFASCHILPTSYSVLPQTQKQQGQMTMMKTFQAMSTNHLFFL
jgi:hypothetical protein